MRIGALLQWTVLFFLVLESLGLIATTLGLVLRIAHPADVYGSSWGHMSVELVLRIAIVVFILSAYRCLKIIFPPPLNSHPAIRASNFACGAEYFGSEYRALRSNGGKDRWIG